MRERNEEKERAKRPLSRRQAHARVTGVLNSTRLTDLLLPIKQGRLRETERESERVGGFSESKEGAGKSDQISSG